MTRIDRYLIVLFVRVFLVCFLTLAGLLIVAQIFTNLDELIEYGRIRGSLPLALAEYFGPVLLTIFDRTCALTALLSLLFVVAWLYRTNEWTAMLAAGVSKSRVIRPLLFVCLIVIFASAISRELWIPKYSHILTRKPQDLQGVERVLPIRPTEDSQYGLLIAGKSIASTSQTIRNPVFVLFGPASSVVGQIQAESAIYQEASESLPAGYLVQGLGQAKFLQQPSVVVEGLDYLRLPTDTPGLKPDECFIPSSVEFDMLRGSTAKQFASTSDLIWRARNQGDYYGDDLQMLIHQRFMQPFSDATQLLLGLPLVLTSRRRNVVQLTIACLLTFGVFFGISVSLSMLSGSSSWLTPTVATWIPLMLFAPYAYAKTRQALME
ncbi:MAG: LptF/LptG family permease [Planctomycetes bacterium]|nr:LptF/LptG family permease [Planctomycetota bacterium]